MGCEPRQPQDASRCRGFGKFPVTFLLAPGVSACTVASLRVVNRQSPITNNQLPKNMIKGVDTMFYSSQPEQLRDFLRDKLKLSFTDVGEGWLIFDLPEAEMGCHPADDKEGSPAGTHNISFYCDDIQKTVSELKDRGVEFIDGIEDHDYGLVTHFKMPGEVEVQLFQPRYRKH